MSSGHATSSDRANPASWKLTGPMSSKSPKSRSYRRASLSCRCLRLSGCRDPCGCPDHDCRGCRCRDPDCRRCSSCQDHGGCCSTNDRSSTTMNDRCSTTNDRCLTTNDHCPTTSRSSHPDHSVCRSGDHPYVHPPDFTESVAGCVRSVRAGPGCFTSQQRCQSFTESSS